MKDLDCGVVYRSTNKAYPRRIGKSSAMISTEGPAPLSATPRIAGFSVRGRSNGRSGQTFMPVGLVEAVLHGGAQEVSPPLGKGRNQESGGLNVGDNVIACIGRRQEGARLCGRKLSRGQHQEKIPRYILPASCCDKSVLGSHEAVIPPR